MTGSIVPISEGRFCASVVLLDQHQQLTEDLTHISTVDFVDDEKELLVRLVGGLLAEAIENTILSARSRHRPAYSPS